MNAHLTATLAYALLLVALLTTAFAQIAFKHYHLTGKRRSFVIALGLFLVIPPATFVAVRYLGVGKVYVLTSLNYAFVAYLGYRFFGETITRGQLQGLVMITLGCILYTF